MGKSDVDKTNAANLQIARETNESNYNIAQMSNEYNSAQLDKQIAEQWRMWRAENEYNTPAAQAERMREAGLNPVLGDIGTGSASSMTSPSPQPAVTPTMVGATMQPDNTFERIIGSLGTLQNSLNSYVDNTYKQTQIVGATQNNEYARQSQKVMLDMLKNSKIISDITAGNEKRRQYLELGLSTEAYNAAIEQTAQMAIKTISANTELNFLEPNLQVDLGRKFSQWALDKKMGLLTDKQIQKECQEIYRMTRENRIGDALESTFVQQGKDQGIITGNQAEASQYAPEKAYSTAGPDNMWQGIYRGFMEFYDLIDTVGGYFGK